MQQGKIEYKITEKLNQERLNILIDLAKNKSLTAESVINEAKDKKSPLHELFEWNDGVAADKWRLQQARVLINEVKVTIQDKEYYAFENVQLAYVDNSGGKQIIGTTREYKPIIQIINNADMRKQIIQRALMQLKYWENQYGNYEELTEVLIAAHQLYKKYL